MAKSIPQAEREKLRSFRAKFVSAFKHEKEWRKLRQEWNRFYDGDQLTSDEKRELERRGQPAVVFNRIKPQIDAIIGVQAGLRVDTKAFNKKAQSFETAKFMSEALRNVEQSNEFDEEEAVAFEDILKGGRAWYKHETVFSDLEPELKTRRAFPEDIYVDPYFRQDDLSDCKFIIETIWSDAEDISELFPEASDYIEELCESGEFLGLDTADPLKKDASNDQYKQDSDTSAYGEMFYDKKRKRVRLCTIWYRKPHKVVHASAEGLGTIVITEYGKKDIAKMKESFPDVVLWNEIKYSMNCCVFVANKILEEKTDVRDYDKHGKYPYVLVPGFTTDDEKRIPYGYVKQMVDPNKEINKRRSKAMHLLNVSGVISEEGAVENEARTKEELARPDFFIKVRPNARFEIHRNLELAQSQFQLLQEAKNEIDETGVNREVQGQQSNANSGKAISRRDEQGMRKLRKLFRNLRRARKRVAQLWLDDIQRFWTNERMVMVTGDEEAGAIVLNQKVVGEDGKEHIVNNVAIGDYDIVIDEAPDTINLESEQFELLVQLASNGLPIPVEAIIESSALPNKKKILESIQSQKQAMAEQAAMAQAQGQPPPK